MKYYICIIFRSLVHHPSKRICTIKQCVPLYLMFWMPILLPSLPTGKLDLGRPILRRMGQEKRFDIESLNFSTPYASIFSKMVC